MIEGLSVSVRTGVEYHSVSVEISYISTTYELAVLLESQSIELLVIILFFQQHTVVHI